MKSMLTPIVFKPGRENFDAFSHSIMYSRLTIARKYLQYFLRSANGKGHGIHSPFVYDFVRNVLNDKKPILLESRIEKLRTEFQDDHRKIEVEDFGAGSSMGKGALRSISEITRSSSKSRKLGKLLNRIATYYQPRIIVELGTSLGFSMSYLASADQNACCYTMEGSAALCSLARVNFERLGLRNISVLTGNFDGSLPDLLSENGVLKGMEIDLAFIDGNHQLTPTLQYFDLIRQRISSTGAIIVDDIHWSAEMEEAWQKIKTDPQVMLSIDLFFLGIVFFRKEFKVKQHFEIRY
jgi:predicted O-methyltransferase YrrM